MVYREIGPIIFWPGLAFYFETNYILLLQMLSLPILIFTILGLVSNHVHIQYTIRNVTI